MPEFSLEQRGCGNVETRGGASVLSAFNVQIQIFIRKLARIGVEEIRLADACRIYRGPEAELWTSTGAKGISRQ
jgi:hypothetical protein